VVVEENKSWPVILDRRMESIVVNGTAILREAKIVATVLIVKIPGVMRTPYDGP